jgi:hypothetical protein
MLFSRIVSTSYKTQETNIRQLNPEARSSQQIIPKKTELIEISAFLKQAIPPDSYLALQSVSISRLK